MTIARLPFGRSGHLSTRTIFGAAALAHVTQEEADRTLELLLRHGVNHIDVASSYGEAELRIAPWLRQHRAHFYLATKADARTAPEAKAELHHSLERLGVDTLDLWQLHSLADPIEWDVALSPGGALEAGRPMTAEEEMAWYEARLIEVGFEQAAAKLRSASIARSTFRRC